MGAPDQEITRILKEHSAGRAGAADRLMPLIYDELRHIAAGFMQHERPDHTLQATALVHEVYVRLVDQENVDWKGRSHFLAIAARMMPRVLLDYGRRRSALKRGGGLCRVSLDGVLAALGDDRPAVDMAALGEMLDVLRRLHERQARVIELRFFGGLSVEETARELDVSKETVKLDTRFARAWLRNKLREDTSP